MWIDTVPEKNNDLGLLLYGQIKNTWMTDMQPNEWRWVSVLQQVLPGGGDNMIIFSMNGAPAGQGVRIASVHLDLFGAKPVAMLPPFITVPEIPDGYLLGNTWYTMQSSKLVGEIDVATDWVFECDLQLGDMNYEFGSLVRFTATNGNWGTYGDEILNLDITSWNELFVASDTVAYPDIYQWTAPLPVGQQMHLKIELAGPKREVWIDGVSVLVINDMGHRESHSAVKIWSGDSFEVPADAKIKNAKWVNLPPQEPYVEPIPVPVVPVGPEPDPNATFLFTGGWTGGEGTGSYLLGDTWYKVQGSNMVGEIQTAENWEFECDVWLGDNWNFGSLIRFTVTDGNWGTYGDEILNIDVTSWNEIFVASDTLAYPDIYEWTSPLEIHQQIHLKVSLHDNVREVSINGVPHLYLDWLGPRETHQNVKVWVGDVFEMPAEAMIKNARWTNFGPT